MQYGRHPEQLSKQHKGGETGNHQPSSSLNKAPEARHLVPFISFRSVCAMVGRVLNGALSLRQPDAGEDRSLYCTGEGMRKISG